MGSNFICKEISKLIGPILKDENLELVDVEYEKEGKNWYLRVFIDSVAGVTLEDCQNTSHLIENLIDIESLIYQKYTLEVSSPGLDRPLKKKRDFLRNKGRKVNLTTLSVIQNRKRFMGVIKDIDNEALVLEIKKSIILIPLKIIAKANLEIKFPEKT